MTYLQEAVQLRSQLVNEWRSGSGRTPNLDKCGELLNRIKVLLFIDLNLCRFKVVDSLMNDVTDIFVV